MLSPAERKQSNDIEKNDVNRHNSPGNGKAERCGWFPAPLSIRKVKQRPLLIAGFSTCWASCGQNSGVCLISHDMHGQFENCLMYPAWLVLYHASFRKEKISKKVTNCGLPRLLSSKSIYLAGVNRQ